MKTFITLILVALMLVTGSCKKSPEGPKQPKPIDLPVKAGQVIAGNNGFGIDLFRVTALEEVGNMMLSPLSASTALTMLLNGCNTQTYGQIRDMLGYEGLTLDEINATYRSLVGQLLLIDPEVQLALANAIWYRQDFLVKQPFLETMDSSYDAEIAALDFYSPSATEIINKWASDNTNGKIDKVLDEIDPQAVMFLMNALYFKGIWTYKFGEESFNDIFFKDNGAQDSVTYMKSLIPVKTSANAQAKFAELPYGSQNFAMVVIVPESTLVEYLNNFDKAEWTGIISGLDAITEAPEVNMIMPRFKFDYEKYLNDQLKSLGMTDAFNPYLADLSGISDADIYINFVKQNTFVEVNEDGTEAAAVTTIGIYVTSFPGGPETFSVDKPFIFAIRERTTNTLLFIGKVEKPVY
jgi:serine protease inhibitor